MTSRSRILLAFSVLAATFAPVTLGQSPATYTYTIPGTVNASGLNGTRFVSDLAISNPGAAPVVAILTLVPANGTSRSLMFLNPGQTVVTRNVLQGLWGASGAAATVVNASGPVLVRARTYNTAASGTYGVALPVVGDDRFVLQGNSADSLWISQSADGSTGYRTNVAVVFPDDDGGDATVTVYDANGRAAGTQAFSLASAGFQQFAVGAFAGAVAVGRARITVTRGRATAYAVVVDNVTGDSSLFAFADLPAGRQDVVANGVARANGRNNTFFRTDARIYNPSSGDATVAVAFHANQNTNPAPASATFVVPAGQIRDVVDVLASLLILPVGSAGALRFTSDAPIAILCRTSNVDPTGSNPGTFGAQQRPTPVLSFLTSADAGAVVTGVRQNGSFRTNVGFAAGADGAAWTLALKNAAGATVSAGSGSLGAWGWTQPNVQDLFPGAAIPDDATLQVTVTSGSVDVFDSSIDNASGDPVVTPIMALPATIPSAATIGPAGGSVRSSDGRFTLKIPAGALSAPSSLSITSATSSAPGAVGLAYTIAPQGLSLNKPGLVVFSYGISDVNGSAAASILPAFQSGSSWYPMPSWSTDTGTRTITSSLAAVATSLRGSARRMLADTPTSFTTAATLRILGPLVVPPGGSPAAYRLKRLKAVAPGVALSDDTPLESGAVHWSVDFGKIAPEGTDPTSSLGLYTPPACPPPHAEAIIEANYHGESGFLDISIFPLTWKLTIDEQVDVPCTIGQASTLEYHVKDHIEQAFSIDDETGAVVPGMVTHASDLASFIALPVRCPIPGTENCGCSLRAFKEPPGLTVGIDSGRVIMGYLELGAQYRHIGVPQWVLTCTGLPPCPAGESKPSDNGSNDSFFTPYGYIPYNGKTGEPLDKSSLGRLVTLVFSAKPTNLSCP